REGGQANVESKRGCPCGCVYCADPISKGRKQRLREPAAVITETRNLLKQGCDCFHFCDCEFNVPKDHAEQLCHAIVSEGLQERISWYCYAIPLGMDQELISLMKRAGCRGINFGVDHGVNSMLERLGRDFRQADIRRVIQCCKQEGVTAMLDLLLGSPGETAETVKEALRFVRNLEPDCVGVSAGVRLYAGTPLVNRLQQDGLLENNPNILGAASNNPGLLRPVFYLEQGIRESLGSIMEDILGDDPRYFIGSNEPVDANYNYNDNALLVQAIQEGARGAYWDILRQIRTGSGSNL
ncbi:MAG TPA: radical SAM protein, partial [bacterium]|nr:radical SAM protein [bacterium]